MLINPGEWFRSEEIKPKALQETESQCSPGRSPLAG